jgi:hypothetical protein
MQAEPYYHSVQDAETGEWRSFFAIRLEAICTRVPCPNGGEKAYLSRLLNRQVDFISTLASLEEGSAVELRFLCRPVAGQPHKGRIDLTLRVRAIHADAQGAQHLAAQMFRSLWPNLVALSDEHTWAPVADAASYAALSAPFSVRHLAELLRREARLHLDRIELLPPKRVGFRGGEEARTRPPATGGGKDSSVYVIFPFIRTFNTLERLCTVLLMQPSPVLVSVALAPTALKDEELSCLLQQIEQCERFAELPEAGLVVIRPERYIPPQRSQAKGLLQGLQHMLFTLRDAPFLLKVQVASPEPISPGLMEALGVAVTEHICTTDPLSDIRRDQAHEHFAGGYDWVLPEKEETRRTAAQNLEALTFTPWVPSAAPREGARLRYLVDAQEANAAFRIPLPQPGEFQGLETALSRTVPPPPDLPTEGMLLGHCRHCLGTQEVRLTRDDRRRHMYVVGQTGTGKSTLLLRMILQDIQAGEGVGVLDPHGELIEEILPRVPQERVDDVLYMNPEDYTTCIGLNLLEYRDALEKDFVVNQLTEIFEKLYNMREVGGPIFELYFRNAALLAMSDPPTGSTLVEIQKIFIDEPFRKRKLAACRDPFVLDFWTNLAVYARGEMDLKNITPYIVSKLTRFLYNDAIRPMIAQQHSTVNFRQVMDEGKILLVDLSRGKIGETNSAFLGMILISLILKATFSRTDAPNRETLRDFYLYIDEFQNLATESFVGMLSEARKYRLNVILTNQYLHQIPPVVRDAVLGNVGTLVSLRVGMLDAQLLEREFAPVFTPGDLMNLATGKGCVSMLVRGEAVPPFSLATERPPPRGDLAIAQAIRGLERRKKYGRERESVEGEILARWGSVDDAEA